MHQRKYGWRAGGEGHRRSPGLEAKAGQEMWASCEQRRRSLVKKKRRTAHSGRRRAQQ